MHFSEQNFILNENTMFTPARKSGVGLQAPSAGSGAEPRSQDIFGFKLAKIFQKRPKVFLVRSRLIVNFLSAKQ